MADNNLLEDIHRKVNEIYKYLFVGNGTPSFATRIDRLEQWRGRFQWGLSLLAGLTIAVAAYSINKTIDARDVERQEIRKLLEELKKSEQLGNPDVDSVLDSRIDISINPVG